jgi:hypothetical protein
MLEERASEFAFWDEAPEEIPKLVTGIHPLAEFPLFSY